MFFSSLELIGFKSFKRAKFIFDSSISIFTGPNGCGKTNIADAIRWVMGEQNLHNLRVKSMTELIFHGADEQKPMNMAEVSMLLNNNNNILPIECDEVKITRRVFPDGESIYMINGNPCRRKDITSLLLDTGLSEDGYFLMNQEKIDAILKSNEERLRLFEEASAISGYKARKEEALENIRKTMENITRIEDIIKELESQRESLKYRASKARRYKRLKDELNVYKYHSLTSEYNEKKGELKKAKIEEERIKREIETIKINKENIKDVFDEEEKIKDELIDRLSIKAGIKGRLNEAEREISHLKLKIERLKEENERDEKEMAKIGLKIAAIENQRQILKENIEKQKKEIYELNKKEEEILKEEINLKREEEIEKGLIGKRLYGILVSEPEIENLILLAKKINLERAIILKINEISPSTIKPFNLLIVKDIEDALRLSKDGWKIVTIDGEGIDGKAQRIDISKRLKEIEDEKMAIKKGKDISSKILLEHENTLEKLSYEALKEKENETLILERKKGRDDEIMFYKTQEKELEKAIEAFKKEEEKEEKAIKIVEKRLSDIKTEIKNLKKQEEKLNSLYKAYEENKEKIKELEISLSIINEKIKTIEAEYSEKIKEIKPTLDKQRAEKIEYELLKEGEIDLSSLLEYDKIKERISFYERELSDLNKAKDDLRYAIGELDKRAKELFNETFEKIRANFSSLFLKVLQGGSADIFLNNGKIEIEVQMPGKKKKGLFLLSSGERTLLSILILFSLFMVKPAPFCLLDEVDASLDEANVKRFVELIKWFSKDTQFLIISHNKRTIEIGDTLYGITMETPGVSKPLSLKLKR